MNVAPDIFRGTLSAGDNLFVATDSRTASQFAVQNLESDGGNSFTIKVSGSTNTWLLAPGEKLGLRMKSSIMSVVLNPMAGSPAYQLLIG